MPGKIAVTAAVGGDKISRDPERWLVVPPAEGTDWDTLFTRG